MTTLQPNDLVSIVPDPDTPYHIGHWPKLIHREEIFIDPKKHTLEGPWIYLGRSKKFHPRASGVKKAKIQWVGSKFITLVREDWIKPVESNALVVE